MNDIAIKVENLSKLYKIGVRQQGYKTLRESIMGALGAPFQRLKKNPQSTLSHEPSAMSLEPSNDTIWALKDISFEVKRGEVVGIIGRNGAGKTTLLKILSRITEPTEGRVEIYGRVGSLLEVGTGFHPELTGRENVYLNGAILGMGKAEIERKFDEIVAFAEIEKFMDTPVKRYSSGMSVRLAFAVAAHLEPEILLVDEVLAVGDIAFQRKCVGKMEDVSMGGRTVLFVSHNLAMVENLCSRLILLEDGMKKLDGATETVISAYLEGLRAFSSTGLRDRIDRRGTGEIRLTDAKVLDGQGSPVSEVASGRNCLLSITYQIPDGHRLSGVTFGMAFYSRGGHLFTVSNELTGQVFDNLPQSGEVLCRIPRLPLAPGKYQFNIICRVRGAVADWITDAGNLEVCEGDFFETGQLPPITHQGALVHHSWSITALEPCSQSLEADDESKP